MPFLITRGEAEANASCTSTNGWLWKQNLIDMQVEETNIIPACVSTYSVKSIWLRSPWSAHEQSDLSLRCSHMKLGIAFILNLKMEEDLS